MSLDETTRRELEELLAAMGAEKFDAAAKRRLNALVGQSEEARKLYLDHCQMHAMLQHSSLLASFKVEEPANVTPMPATSTSWTGMAIAACAMFFIGLSAAFLLPSKPTQEATVSAMRIATVDAISGKVWLGESELVDGAEVTSGEIRVESGSITLRFDHGTELLVEGSTELTIETDMQVTLHRGKVAARVTEEAHGFTILGPDSAVVDLGTEFAMAVEDGQGWVDVYDGEVDISLLNRDGHAWKSRQLTASGPVRIDSPNGRIVDEEPPVTLPRFAVAPPEGLKVPAKYVEAITSSRPVHYWRFDGAAGETAEDAINRASAVLEGGVQRFDGGLHFPPGRRNHGSLFIASPEPTLFDKEFSFEFWVKPAFAQQRVLLRVDHRDATNRFREKMYRLSLIPAQHRTVYPEQTFRFVANLWPHGEEGEVSVFSADRYETDAWQHVVAVRRKDRVEIYLNGRVSHSTPAPAPLPRSMPAVITIGKFAGPQKPGTKPDRNFFKGLLDEVAMYSRALSAEEVAEHHRLMQSR